MDHEFKIIISFKDGQTPAASKVRVYLDDQIIGALQTIKFEADSTAFIPKLEITFPEATKYSNLQDLDSWQHKTDRIASKLKKLFKSIITIKYKG
jgi:hypothetical protein